MCVSEAGKRCRSRGNPAASQRHSRRLEGKNCPNCRDHLSLDKRRHGPLGLFVLALVDSVARDLNVCRDMANI